jgi:4-aminobutyrate aminotransferase-like enzyme
VEIATLDGAQPLGERTARIVDEMRNRRVLVGISGPDANVIKIRPPLVFSRTDSERLLEAMDAALREVG